MDANEVLRVEYAVFILNGGEVVSRRPILEYASAGIQTRREGKTQRNMCGNAEVGLAHGCVGAWVRVHPQRRVGCTVRGGMTPGGGMGEWGNGGNVGHEAGGTRKRIW